MSRANSVFVPENKVNEYLSKNDITLERMQNGITFVGVSRLVDDDNQAEVVLKFESGSYNDPSRIQGIHHLVEHLVLNRINKNPHATDVYHNAYTNYKNVSIILSGIANTKVTNYAIWPMIKHMARVIKDPLASKTLAKDLASEVKVVLNELYEKQADMKWHHYKFLNRCIYDPKNPICTDGLGNETTLSKISKEDIERILSELFIPKGLTVAVFTEGDST
ncbi:MAG TPA: insulinase family protein, partial [Patescibacteria group bacterium]|nr:insulinase family protein [Patescibacteria group bacterium]